MTMNDNINKINTDELLRNIARYFECMLSDEEERELRYQLARTDLDHPIVEEAKAVMGFQTIRKQVLSKKVAAPVRKSPVRKLGVSLSVAASIALIFVVGFSVISSYNNHSRGECIAFVNGRVLTDEDDVWQIVMQDAGELGEALNECQEGISDDMEDLGTIVEAFDLNPDPSELI